MSCGKGSAVGLLGCEEPLDGFFESLAESLVLGLLMGQGGRVEPFAYVFALPRVNTGARLEAGEQVAAVGDEPKAILTPQPKTLGQEASLVLAGEGTPGVGNRLIRILS